MRIGTGKSARHHVSAGREYDPIGSPSHVYLFIYLIQPQLREADLWPFPLSVAQSPVCS